MNYIWNNVIIQVFDTQLNYYQRKLKNEFKKFSTIYQKKRITLFWLSIGRCSGLFLWSIKLKTIKQKCLYKM